MTATPGTPAPCPGTRRRASIGMLAVRPAIAWISSTASPSATPGARLNDSVTAGNWPWWLTDSGCDLVAELGEGAERDLGAVRARHIDACDSAVGSFWKFGCDLEDHLVLVGRGVDRRRPGAGRTRRRASGRSATSERPRREAASRSISMRDMRRGDLLVGGDVLQLRQLLPSPASMIGAQWLSSSVSVSVSVYWYSVLLSRPPTLMSWPACMKNLHALDLRPPWAAAAGSPSAPKRPAARRTASAG